MGRFATFIIGGVVGAVAGLLLAPAKGSDTRKQVVEAAVSYTHLTLPTKA